MIFELIEFISSMALLLIALQLSLISIQFRRKEKSELIRKTYEEVYKNNEQRNLLLEVSSYTQGKEYDVEELMNEDKEFRDDVYEAINYCEYLAMGIEHGILDERMVQITYRNLLFNIYTHFERVIKESRMNSNDPETFRYFSQLIEKWKV
jgi:hypothetical protein